MLLILLAIVMLLMLRSKPCGVSDSSCDGDRIACSHKFCANMRSGSPSLTTTSVPVRDANGDNEFWFPVSVCCATCLCHFWPPKQSDRFYYAQQEGGEYVLMRRGSGSDELVQYLENPSTTQQESERIQKDGGDRYLTFLSYDKVDGICKLMK